MSPSPQGYRQPWEEPSPEREVFDEMLRRPYEELHAENQVLREAVDVLQRTNFARGYVAVEELRGVVATLLAENQRLREALALVQTMIRRADDRLPEAAGISHSILYDTDVGITRTLEEDV